MGNGFEGIFDLIESTLWGEDGGLTHQRHRLAGAAVKGPTELTRESYRRDMVHIRKNAEGLKMRESRRSWREGVGMKVGRRCRWSSRKFQATRPGASSVIHPPSSDHLTTPKLRRSFCSKINSSNRAFCSVSHNFRSILIAERCSSPHIPLHLPCLQDGRSIERLLVRSHPKPS